MIDHAEYTAGFEGLVECGKRAFEFGARQPVVQIAKGDDKVGAAGWRDLVQAGVEGRHHDLVVERWFSLEAR